MSNRIKLPPLNALKAFHSTARHGSVRGAAEELLVTPQAVSQQIKLLEDTLQVTLFERRGRVIEQTEAAILLAKYVESGFEELAEGVRRVTNKKYQDRITVNVSPYFATRYLLNRLESFRQSLPKSDLRMTTMVEMPDFKRDDIDVAIQWGYGTWEGYETNLLLKDYKIICCTPKLAENLTSIRCLAKQHLLHPVLQNSLWENILTYLDVDMSFDMSQTAFHDAATMRHATLSGMGVGLLSQIDAANDIRSGQLVAPFGDTLLQNLPEEQVPGFYLVLPKSHRRIASTAAFCSWVSEQNWGDPNECILP